MRNFIEKGLCIGLIIFAFSTQSFAQSFGRVEADLLRANGTIENIAPEATAAVSRIYADDGDDNADKYSLNVSTADVFSIQNNGTAIWSMTSAGAITSPSTASFTTTATVLGADAGNASMILDADRGDDSGDTWTIRSTASGNALDILNEAVVAITVTTAGAATFTANTTMTYTHLIPQASPPGSPTAGDIYVDTTGATLCIYNGSAWKGIMPATDGNCA